jgi:class 3 adenylate cyclase
MLDWFTHPEPSELREQRLERTRHAIRADVAGELYALSFDVDVTTDLAGIRVPTLVTHRTGSRAVPYSLGQRVAAIVPDAQFVPLDGSAHNPWEGDGAQPLAAIAAFTGRPVDRAFSAHPRIRPVVILFTDMEGSTATTIRMGDQSAQQLVRVHHDVVSRALQSHGGTRVKGTGDGVLAEFASVSSAIHAALEIQQRLDRHNAANPDAAVPLRIGINAGEAVSELDDLYGQVVNAASRICDQARAGEVIVSNVVRELAAGKGFRFDELGPFDLRGMSEPVRLYRVG